MSINSKVQLQEVLMDELDDWLLTYDITTPDMTGVDFDMKRDLLYEMIELMSDRGVISLPPSCEEDDEHYNDCLFGNEYD